jgi:hypothetical protein
LLEHEPIVVHASGKADVADTTIIEHPRKRR